MSTIATRHPDQDLLDRMERALRWWAEEAPSSTPTSSITGGGAVAEVEHQISTLTGAAALALPNATFALRVALLAAGVRAGDDVVVGAADWPAGRAAVRSVGAVAVPAHMDPETVTIDPRRLADAGTTRPRAVIVTHPHGICADVPAIRRRLPRDVIIIEDCAQALGATLDGVRAGSRGDVAVFSFGPGKVVDAGELGVLSARPDLMTAALSVSQHPVRRLLAGVADYVDDGLMGRASPLGAILAAYELDRLRTVEPARRASDAHARAIVARVAPTVNILTGVGRRHGEAGTTALLLPCDTTIEIERELARRLWTTGGHVLARSTIRAHPSADATEVTDRVRIIKSTAGHTDHDRTPYEHAGLA